jgi:hypothetical protein
MQRSQKRGIKLLFPLLPLKNWSPLERKSQRFLQHHPCFGYASHLVRCEMAIRHQAIFSGCTRIGAFPNHVDMEHKQFLVSIESMKNRHHTHPRVGDEEIQGFLFDRFFLDKRPISEAEWKSKWKLLLVPNLPKAKATRVDIREHVGRKVFQRLEECITLAAKEERN